MSLILDLLESGDVCSLGCLIFLLAVVGAGMIGNRRELQAWGARLAGAAFVLYCIYGGIQFRPSDAQDVLWLVFRAILAGGVSLGASWICLSAFAFLRRFLFEAPAKRVRQRASRQRKHLTDARYEEQQRERERLRLEQEAQEQSRKLRQQTARSEAKRRQDAARASAILTFHSLAHRLQGRFDKADLDEFLSTFVTPDTPADQAERLVDQLIGTLQQPLEEEKPTTGAASLEELIGWYERRRQEIDSLPIDQKLKRFYESQLSTRLAELSARLFENIEPQTHMGPHEASRPTPTDLTDPQPQDENDAIGDPP